MLCCVLPFTHHPLPNASITTYVTIYWPRSFVKPSSNLFSKTLQNQIYDMTIQTLILPQGRAWAGAHSAERGQAMVSVTQLVLLKKCHLIDAQIFLGQQPGHSLRSLIRWNLKGLKKIMANIKAPLLRRTFGSLALLAKPFNAFRTSVTDAVDAHYCWLKKMTWKETVVCQCFCTLWH